MNMGSLVTRNARHWPAGLARVCGDQKLTHRQLNHEVNRLANALLALGVIKGDRIATLLPACPELMEVQWAAAKIGAVLVPLAPSPNGDKGVGLLQEARASLVVASTATADAVASIKPRLPIAHDRYLLTDAARTGFRDFHGLKAAATTAEPEGQPAGHRDPLGRLRHRAYLSGRGRFQQPRRAGVLCGASFRHVADDGGQQDCLRKPGSIGIPMPFCDLRVVDPNGRPLTLGEIGEIRGLGPAADGIFGGGPASRPAWLATGEMGTADEDGFIYRIARHPAGQPQTEGTSNPKGAER